MNRANTQTTSSIEAAISAMKSNRPLRAEEICREYLALKPGCTDHLRVLGHALMKQGRLEEAEKTVALALKIKPDQAELHEDRGSLLAMSDRFQEAIEAFDHALMLNPNLALSHKKRGQALAQLGRGDAADAAFEDFFASDPALKLVAEGAEKLRAGESVAATECFTEALLANPDNVDAMRYLALCWHQQGGRNDDAEALLRRAVDLAPDFAAAWQNLGAVLVAQSKAVEAVEAYRAATRIEPGNALAWGGLGNALALAGNITESAAAYSRSVELDPGLPGTQLGLAHVLKTLGKQSESLDAYRASIRVKPDFGEAYWSMANLKTFRFNPDEIAAMERELEKPELANSPRTHLHFALGKAYEDMGDYPTAWQHYVLGNQAQRPSVFHDPIQLEQRHREIIEVFSNAFICQHNGCGYEAADPIFIVGLPRSGSTLIEQILSSHSLVEGTAELPNLSKIASSVGKYRPDRVRYPLAARDLGARDWRSYGLQYIEETRRQRITGKPFFTDKLPNNFPQIGFLHLILPNAKVINARRHPLDSCLGNFKQLFGKGQNFTYDMDELTDYYRSYVQLMHHWDEVLPGKVLEVHYEDTVLDFENTVMRILDHCGLPFEESCLRFHENDRAVRTASSEQVRQPIYTGSLGQWKRFEPQLRPWYEALEDIIDALPDRIKRAGPINGC